MCTLDFFFLMNVLFLETLLIFYLKKMKRKSSLEWCLIPATQTFRRQRQKNFKFIRCLKKCHKSKIYGCFIIYPISCYSYWLSRQALKQE